MKKKLFASLLVGSAVIGASLAPLSAQAVTTGNTPVQVEFGGGALPDQDDNSGGTTAPEPGTPNTDFDILAIPKGINFATSKIGEDLSAIEKSDLDRKLVHVGDVRGTKEGWHLTAEIPQLVNGNDKLDGELNFTLPAYYSAFVTTSGSGYYVRSLEQGGINIQDNTSAPDFIGTNIKLGSGAVTLINAPTGKGQGMWATELENLTLNVTTPMQQLKKGAYTGNITWNLVAGPSI
ncbi:WxL domain-containing protein [Enterococcus faecalis]|uniref:WxL domain-containing protein n=1 Tax=Enterococcus faecalis TaxID=1351 RepID=UPI001C5A65FB|nr:WxL domain-containing protein [Enterococcus faecalis]MBW4168783.1 WxL domain-containing protein [Enterococcus faecalis]MBW4173638.1 WxL domain-containing protein [Enterococcus faecalis]MBW4176527.1 WxL domain-containing protein [Enterococcus faecalis]MCD4999970.1 WxL domain-containing protein [Enterococcus faecalis]MCD5267052.1 WxL domain-containing protein [Enterococcus faecalis]